MKKITFSKDSYNLSKIYKELKILKFDDLLYVQNCIFMKRVETGLLPERFTQQFHYRKTLHNHNTRASSKGLLEIPSTETHKYGKLATTYRCIKDWNKFISLYTQKELNSLSYSEIRHFLGEKIISNY